MSSSSPNNSFLFGVTTRKTPVYQNQTDRHNAFLSYKYSTLLYYEKVRCGTFFFTINSARVIEYILCIGHYLATSFLDTVDQTESSPIYIKCLRKDLEPYLTWNCGTHHLVSSGMCSEVRVDNRVGMTAWSEQMVRDVQDIALQHCADMKKMKHARKHVSETK